MASPGKPKLRKLLLKFYQENDPVILQKGFDINGLVEFTSEKGIDVVNRMLNKKYGKMIDINEEVGSAKQEFNRMSAALTASTFIISKEQEYRKKLFDYFNKHDASMVGSARAAQFEKFVKFAMLNGIDKLSDKLRQKYGEGVEGGNEIENNEGAVDVNKDVYGDSGENPFNLDKNRLRDDLEEFYTEMEDVEQLEVLDQMTDWACQMGIEEFDKKLEQLYGTTLNDFLQSVGKKGHNNQVAAAAEPEPVPRPLPAVAPRALPPVEVEDEYETVEEVVMVPAPERDFEEMSDDEILAELRAFYTTHDEENLGNLERVLELSRRIGRDNLNEHLTKIYEQGLTPVPAFIEQRVQKQVLKPKRALPAMPPRQMPEVPSSPSMPPGLGQRPIPSFDDPPRPVAPANDPPRPVPPANDSYDETGFGSLPAPIPTFRPPPGVPGGLNMNSFQANLQNAVQAGGQLKKTEPPRKISEDSEDDMPEWMKKQRGMKKRIDLGKALVRDADGTVMEVNILIDVCKNYTLDVMTGICTCGFAKGDHVWGEKRKKKRR